MQELKIKWVVAHEPLDLFIKAANTFAKYVSQLSNGAITVDVMTVNQYAEKNNFTTNNVPVFKELVDGKIHMGQYTSGVLGTFLQYYDMFLLDMPFLFRDHEHAKSVLEGEIGETLLANMSKRSLTGLAFTYSGGFRIVTSKEPIRTIADFNGKTFSVGKSPILEGTLKALGANTHGDLSYDIVKHMEEKPDINFEAAESTLVRYDSVKNVVPYITDTKHSLFLTSIVINNKFWESLDSEARAIIKQAAMNAAAEERETTISDSEEFVNAAKDNCAGYYTFTEEELADFKKAVQPLYEEIRENKKYTPGLIEKIMLH
jgi:hypothetical protein